MRIAVLGVGHMGRWLLAELTPDHETAAYDIDPTRTTVLDRTAVLTGLDGLAAFRPDILVNAVSLGSTIAAFEAAAPHLGPDCLLCDVASVKGEIAAYYRRSGFRFASVHPMFGPTFANVRQLRDENLILIDESDPRGVRFLRGFFAGLGLRVTECSFEEHDRMISYSLALPFASTMVFAACMDRSAVPGTTFKKHLEIARGLLSEDDVLLQEILFGPHSLEQLEKVTSRLEFLKHVIRGRDGEEAGKFFARLRDNIR